MDKFIDKLHIERNILNQVNKLNLHPKLSGLSILAIKNWKENHPNLKPELIDRLIELSNVIGSLCDRSGEPLNETDKINYQQVEFLSNRLFEVIGQYS